MAAGQDISLMLTNKTRGPWPMLGTFDARFTMSGVIEILKKISAVPERAGSAFEDWLEQTETVQFLEQNARETELVVYASLHHILVQTVLVSSNQLDPPDME